MDKYYYYPNKIREAYFTYNKQFSKPDIDLSNLNKLDNLPGGLYPHKKMSIRPVYPQHENLKGVVAYYYQEKLNIQLPEKMVIRPLTYKEWKYIYPDKYDEKTMRKILKLCILEIFPANFPLFSVINKRPLFWMNLYYIIEQISSFSHNEENEAGIAKRVSSYTNRYHGTLDGIYDKFVFENFIQYPEVWLHFRQLDYDERLEWLGFYQAVLGVDVWERVSRTRKGISKYMNLRPEKNSPELTKNNNIQSQMTIEAQAKLTEALQQDKMTKYKRKINTASENSEFENIGE